MNIKTAKKWIKKALAHHVAGSTQHQDGLRLLQVGTSSYPATDEEIIQAGESAKRGDCPLCWAPMGETR